MTMPRSVHSVPSKDEETVTGTLATNPGKPPHTQHSTHPCFPQQVATPKLEETLRGSTVHVLNGRSLNNKYSTTTCTTSDAFVEAEIYDKGHQNKKYSNKDNKEGLGGVTAKKLGVPAFLDPMAVLNQLNQECVSGWTP